MITPLRPASSEAGVSLGATSAYTPRSRTLRAIRWQYCPPASRTVICGRKFVRLPGGLARAGLLCHALHQQFLGVFHQRASLRHGIDGLQYFRILLDGHALRFFLAERGDVHLALEFLLDPVAIGREIGRRELGLLRFQKLPELVDHVVARLPAL